MKLTLYNKQYGIQVLVLIVCDIGLWFMNLSEYGHRQVDIVFKAFCIYSFYNDFE